MKRVSSEYQIVSALQRSSSRTPFPRHVFKKTHKETKGGMIVTLLPFFFFSINTNGDDDRTDRQTEQKKGVNNGHGLRR